MKLFILTITFLLVQLSDQVNQNQSFYQASQFLMFSLQAAMNRAEAEYNLNEPYLWCPCTFDTRNNTAFPTDGWTRTTLPGGK